MYWMRVYHSLLGATDKFGNETDRIVSLLFYRFRYLNKKKKHYLFQKFFFCDPDDDGRITFLKNWRIVCSFTRAYTHIYNALCDNP